MARKGKKSVTLPQFRAMAVPEMSLANENAPTPERMMKLPGVAVATSLGSRQTVAVFQTKAEKPIGEDQTVRITDAPLDRLAARGRLDEGDAYHNMKLHEAGDRLRQHWYQAGLDGSLGSIDLNRTGGGNGHPAWLTPSQESTAYHRDRFRRARDGMEAGHWQVVFGICCGEDTLEGAGRQAGFGNPAAASAVALDRLRRGLFSLAVAWGVLPPHPINDNAVAAAELGRAVSVVVRGDEVDAIIDGLMLANASVPMKRAVGE